MTNQTPNDSDIKIEVTGDSQEDLVLGLKGICLTYQNQENVYPTTSNNGCNQRFFLSICINIDNAAFSELPYGWETDWETTRNTPPQVALVTETCRILEKLANEISLDTDCKLYDINGGSVGRAKVTEAELVEDV